jgi:hypothetical protein
MKCTTSETERNWEQFDRMERSEVLGIMDRGLQTERNPELRHVLGKAVDALRGKHHEWLTLEASTREHVLRGFRHFARQDSANRRRARVFRAAVRMLEELQRN